jgi:hypothetical protein
MQGKINGYYTIVAVAVLLSLTAGIVSAAPSTQSITYQGKLADSSGNSLTGTYPVTFSLYDVSSGGTALATDTHSVTAAKGLFTTQITFDPSLYDGRGLWLGIAVGSDPEMTPRQDIRPVPYALALVGSASGSVTTIVLDIQTKVNTLLAGVSGLEANVSAIKDKVDAPRKPIRYEYYTSPMADPEKYVSLISTKSLMDRNTMTNTGNSPADICWYKYLSAPSSESFSLSSSGCAVIAAGTSRVCNPTTVFMSNRSEIMKFTTNSSSVIPRATLMLTDGRTIIETYLPGDFQKVEIYE